MIGKGYTVFLISTEITIPAVKQNSTPTTNHLNKHEVI